MIRLPLLALLFATSTGFSTSSKANFPKVEREVKGSTFKITSIYNKPQIVNKSEVEAEKSKRSAIDIIGGKKSNVKTIYKSKSKTTLYSKDKVVWVGNFYVGSRNVEVSPDGKYMIVWGEKASRYFENITGSISSTVGTVYKNGKPIRLIKLSEFFEGKGLPEDPMRGKRSKIGGGGFPLGEYFEGRSVDWKKKEIVFTYKNFGKTRLIRFGQ